jgi:hypothetical protein
MGEFRALLVLSYLAFGSLASWAQTGSSAALVRLSIRERSKASLTAG